MNDLLVWRIPEQFEALRSSGALSPEEEKVGLRFVDKAREVITTGGDTDRIVSSWLKFRDVHESAALRTREALEVWEKFMESIDYSLRDAIDELSELTISDSLHVNDRDNNCKRILGEITEARVKLIAYRESTLRVEKVKGWVKAERAWDDFVSSCEEDSKGVGGACAGTAGPGAEGHDCGLEVRK